MTLRAALLGLLSEGPATGYDLIKDFAVSNSVIWSAPKGEVYRELAKLERDGFASRDAKAGVRRQRKWHITANGRSELKRWLKDKTDYRLRYEPMLRAVFLSALTPKEIRETLAEDRRFFESELASLKQTRANPGAKAEIRRYGLPMAIAFYEAMLKWCDTADALVRKG